jgi:putative membrane protein
MTIHTTSHNRYLLILAILFAVEWLALAIKPYDRHAWLLENALVFVLVAIIALTYKRIPLSRISMTLIFLFLCLHEVGTHYTYAKVPYNVWTQEVFGKSLNIILGWERNNFDRFVHFSYGLLLAYPVREVFLRIAYVRGFWGYFFPLDITISTSMIFELFEWAAAEIFGGDLGIAYLGTQGDAWDAHKDVLLASIGAAIAMIITIGINIHLENDFAREWADSLKVKKHRPLGEDEMKRLWRKRNKNNISAGLK